MSSRRDFLKTVAVGGGGLALAVSLPVGNRFAQAPTPAEFAPNAFLRIHPDNRITVVVKHAEMGQGVSTSLPMIVAEELDADWRTIGFEAAPAGKPYYHTAFGAQVTGGSTSVASAYAQMRQAGATARAMLIGAAAASWGVEPASCSTEAGFVIHTASGRKAAYGELSGAAAKLPVPENVPLKEPAKFRIVGQPTKRLDSREKSDGTSMFGLDVRLPGMLTAVVARPPVFGARLKSVDSKEAEAVKGVVKVVTIRSGVAVVATDFWTAKKARDLLKPIWEDGPEKSDSAALTAQYQALMDKPGAIARSDGDVEVALGAAKATLDATFTFPYLAHAPMEPLNCVAHVHDGMCELWTGTQFQTGDQMAGAAILGIPPDKIVIHNMMLGGGFGRRANKDADFTAEAMQIAAALAPTPVRTVWTREDDTRGGYYRPLTVHRVRAGIDADGKPVAWHQRIASQSILAGTPFEQFMVKDGVDETTVEGAKDMPYNIPNQKVECHLTKTAVPVLWWRSVGHTHTAFVKETMIDRLAELAKLDPVTYRLNVLARDPRHRGVLELVADRASWLQPLAKKPGMRRGRGVALHESFGSVVAEVAEISIDQAGKLTVDRIVCAVDCGQVINPLTIEAQLQSAVVFGLSAALYGRITLKDGATLESNFHDYQVLRINEMPKIEVHIHESKAAPSGIGEPGTPPVAPALCNAIYAAIGKRVVNLPIDLSS